MRCVVFEPTHSGHHFQYVRHLVAAVAEVADEVVVVLGRESVETDAYREFLEPIDSCMTVDPAIRMPDRPGIGRVRALASALRSAARRHRADHVYVPYANGVAQVLGIERLAGRSFGRGVESEGLLMQERFAYPARSWTESVQLRIYRATIARAPWTVLHHLDPIAYSKIMEGGGDVARRSRLMPEPVETIPRLDPREARRRLGIPEEGRYVGCGGRLSRRKGPDLLLRAFARAACGASDRLLLAGGIEPWLLPIIERECPQLLRDGRLVTIDRFLTDEELGWSLSAMDVVAATYRPEHFGSSGFVVRAPAAGRYVLGCRYNWIGQTIERFDLGQTCDVLDVDELAEAIPEALDAAGGFELSEAGRRFIEYHTVPNFGAAWTSRLRTRLGLPQAEGQRTWEWVNEPLDPERSD